MKNATAVESAYPTALREPYRSLRVKPDWSKTATVMVSAPVWGIALRAR